MIKEYITVNIKSLKPYKNNPRKNDEAVPAVQESIKQCGYITPIVVDENLEIMAGNTRYKALLGNADEIQVLQVSGLTDEQKRKYRLLDNKVGEVATWDFDKLELELEGLDFDGVDFGFDLGEDISPDDFGEDFSLPDGDKPETVYLSLTLNIKQKELIEYAISLIGENVKETFGNTNKAGNAIYEVVRQWAEQKK